MVARYYVGMDYAHAAFSALTLATAFIMLTSLALLAGVEGYCRVTWTVARAVQLAKADKARAVLTFVSVGCIAGTYFFMGLRDVREGSIGDASILRDVSSSTGIALVAFGFLIWLLRARTSGLPETPVDGLISTRIAAVIVLVLFASSVPYRLLEKRADVVRKSAAFYPELFSRAGLEVHTEFAADGSVAGKYLDLGSFCEVATVSLPPTKNFTGRFTAAGILALGMALCALWNTLAMERGPLRLRARRFERGQYIMYIVLAYLAPGLLAVATMPIDDIGFRGGQLDQVRLIELLFQALVACCIALVVCMEVKDIVASLGCYRGPNQAEDEASD